MTLLPEKHHIMPENYNFHVKLFTVPYFDPDHLDIREKFFVSFHDVNLLFYFTICLC